MPDERQLRMPGATLLSRLKVYDSVAPDGQRGGTPHVHLLCTELYFVLAGRGAVELIDADGFRTVQLRPHAALLFSPGTLHRLINPDGELEILVLMANSGLPERGDNVVCFSEEWMTDQARYDEAMRVTTLAEAYRRRDRGVEGFLELKAAFAEGPEAGRQALYHFLELAAARTAARRPEWARIVDAGALAEARASQDHLAALGQGETGYLLAARQHLIEPGDFQTPGYCGHLDRYFDPATLTPEGLRHP